MTPIAARLHVQTLMQRVLNEPLLAMLGAAILTLPLNLSFLWWLLEITETGLTAVKCFTGLDFVNYWSGGYLASKFEAARLYAYGPYNQWIKDIFHPLMDYKVFSYPPNILVLLVPFGVMPYGVGLVVWSVLGVFGFWLVSFYHTPLARSWLPIALMLTGAAVINNAAFGQLGFFLACGFVGALRFLPTRPLLAGVLIGLLTIKPQLGPLLIMVLLVRQEWLAIFSATVTALALFAISLALWGIDPWQAYFTETMRLQSEFLYKMKGFWSSQMTTPYSGFRFLGAPYVVALGAQVLGSIVIAIVSFVVLRRRDCSWPLQVTVITFGASLFTPYLLSYDLVIPLAALLWYLSTERAQFSRNEILVLCVLWAMPFAIGICLQLIGIPVLSMVMIAGYIMLVRRALNAKPLHAT